MISAMYRQLFVNTLSIIRHKNIYSSSSRIRPEATRPQYIYFDFSISWKVFIHSFFSYFYEHLNNFRDHSLIYHNKTTKKKEKQQQTNRLLESEILSFDWFNYKNPTKIKCFLEEHEKVAKARITVVQYMLQKSIKYWLRIFVCCCAKTVSIWYERALL